MGDDWRAEFVGGSMDGEVFPLTSRDERFRRGQAMYRCSTVDPSQKLFQYVWDPSDRNPVAVNRLTFLGFTLNGAAGSGNYDHISIADIKRVVRDGTVFEFLGNAGLDVSLLEKPDQVEILRDWQNLADAVDEGRKFAVDRGGLCLLVAYVFEGIQRRAGWVMG